MDFHIREMKIDDYPQIYDLWMSIKGFGSGIRRRVLLRKQMAESSVRFCAATTEDADAFTMSVSEKISENRESEKQWQ